MNYLSHFVVEHPEEEPAVISGLVFPDVYHPINKIYNQHLRKLKVENEEIQKFIFGIERHKLADHVFHELPRFKEACVEVEKMIHSMPELNIKRVYFLAHIIVELMMDRYLVIHRSEMADNLYDCLQRFDIINVSTFITSMGFNDKEMKMSIVFSNFVKNRFIYRLRDIEGVSRVLEFLYFKVVGKDTFEGVNAQKWLKLLDRCYEFVEGQTETLISEVKYKVNNDT